MWSEPSLLPALSPAAGFTLLCSPVFRCYPVPEKGRAWEDTALDDTALDDGKSTCLFCFPCHTLNAATISCCNNLSHLTTTTAHVQVTWPLTCFLAHRLSTWTALTNLLTAPAVSVRKPLAWTATFSFFLSPAGSAIPLLSSLLNTNPFLRFTLRYDKFQTPHIWIRGLTMLCPFLFSSFKLIKVNLLALCICTPQYWFHKSIFL